MNSDGQQSTSEILDSKMSTMGKCDENPSTSTTVSVSMPSAFVPLPRLPEDIILSILKRLQVKSIIRFNCVSKHWLSLLSSPNFISSHLQETLRIPLNDSFIIRCFQTYLLHVNSIDREPVSLVRFFPEIFRQMELVGSINGLLCLINPPLGQTVILWNPAMNLHKAIRLPITDEDTQISSWGFGYDSVNDDYKIFRIDFLKNSTPEVLRRSRAEVYSVSLDSWERVQIDLHFVTPVDRNSKIAKGIPYWPGIINHPKNEIPLTKILMYYDMQNGSFKYVSLPHQDLYHVELLGKQYVDWKGNLGRIVSRGNFLDISVYDEMRMCWDKISSHGPIGLEIKTPVQCSKDGLILVETKDRKLFLYDPGTSGIKEFCTPGTFRLLDETLTYTESLVTITGMEKLKEQDRDKSEIFLE